ncbi:HflK protein [Rhodobacterales bacterium 52_120_T64]|nr:HflK protein [Rhodobacterales bacterium 52_120_T64]
MPNSSNSGGPWGGGGNNGDDDDRNKGNQGGQPPQVPDIDELVRKGSEQLKVLMGGGGGGGANGAGGGFGKGTIGLGALAVLALWAFASFYSVKPEEQSVELLFGKYHQTGNPGLNFAPWPFVTAQVMPVTRENTEDIGVGSRGSRLEEGLMLTGDENIVDIDFQVVWNISDAPKFLFNLADAQETIRAVSEAAMREVIARSDLAPILNRDRAAISQEVRGLIQGTLDTYSSGVNIVRLNFDKADPPVEVIDAFRDVQAAEQERDTLEKRADAYANERLAAARGSSVQLLQTAEAYRAQVVNTATGEASRFLSVYEEYAKAEEVTRKRLYLETMERVFADVTKIIIDEDASGSGVVPYLPLNELNKGGSN